MAQEPNNSILGSLSDVAANARRLFTLDAMLLKAEMAEKASSFVKALVALAVFSVLSLIAVSYFVYAMFLMLVDLGWQPKYAALLIALGFLAIAIAGIVTALRSLLNVSAMPKRTIAQFDKNVHAIKQSFFHGAVNDNK